MKCHYEVLGVARNASDDDIKKSYRKLALKWHPDKNLDNTKEAKEQFQLVQQAWETLNDPHERTWYDNHREAILKGGIGEDYKDDSINLFPYFSAACFKGYGDDAKSFYTIYRNLFEKLAAEDAEFAKNDESDEEEIPSFGDSQSSYEDVVHNFYAYWQSYSTKRSFAWLDPYDVRDLPNRRVFRLAEKENKKVREKAKRERNEQVRNLVAFIRKRDKRVQAYAAKLAERARENSRKAEERKKAHLLERQKLLHEQHNNQSEWSKFSNIEAELEKIETNLANEFEMDDKDDKEDDTLYCIACNKIFKTHKAFMNHENSRKHKEKVSTLKHFMLNDDENDRDSSQESNLSSESTSLNGVELATDSQMPDFLLNPLQNDMKRLDDEDNEDISAAELISDDEDDSGSPISTKKKIDNENIPVVATPQMESTSFLLKTKNDDVTSEDELISDQEEENLIAKKSNLQKKKKNKKRNIQNPDPVLDHASNDDMEINEEMWLSKKQRKKQQKKAAIRQPQNDEEIHREEKQEAEDEIKVLEEASIVNEETSLSKKQRKKLQQKKAATAKQSQNNEKIHKEEKQEEEDEIEVLEKANIVNERLKGDKTKKECKKEERQSKGKSKKDPIDIDDLAHCCASCSSEFSSKNKLFEHLKKTGHSVYIPELHSKKNSEKKEKTSKGKDSSDKRRR